MQVGSKYDEVGWKSYQICAKYGAMIATGHEHSYSRTKTLTAIGNRSRAHGAIGSFDQVLLRPNHTFVFVSGLGGKSARPYSCFSHDDDTWWASIYASNYILKNGVPLEPKDCDFMNPTRPQKTERTGVLFMDFNYLDDPRVARGQFVTSEGKVYDDFFVTR